MRTTIDINASPAIHGVLDGLPWTETGPAGSVATPGYELAALAERR